MRENSQRNLQQGMLRDTKQNRWKNFVSCHPNDTFPLKCKRFAAALTVVVILIIAPGCRENHNQAANELLAAFASGCPTVGLWTQTALNQTQSLRTTISNLQNNNRCRAASSALGTAQSMHDVFQRLAEDPRKQQLREAQEVERQLILQMHQTSDPNIVLSLAPSLAQAEVNLGQAQAALGYAAENNQNTAMISGLNQAYSYLNSLLSDETGLAACAADSPQLGMQLGAGALSIAGSFVSPVIGSILSAAGQLISGLVQFARQQHLQQAMSYAEGAQMQMALACGLEAMENTFCQAQDFKSLIDLQAHSYNEQWQPTSFWRGLDLWTRRLPSFLRWATRVSSGAPPNDTFDSDRLNAASDAVSHILNQRRTFTGLSRNTDQRLARLQREGNRSDAERVVRSALAQILTILLPSPYGGGGDSGPNRYPASQFFQTQPTLLYRLVGKVIDCNASSPFGSNCLNAETIPLPAGDSGRAQWTTISLNTFAVFDQVHELLLANLHSVFEPDPSAVLRDAFSFENQNEPTPMAALQNFLTFLEESIQYQSQWREQYSSSIALMIETKALLSQVVEKIVSANGNRENDATVINEIFSLLNLSSHDFLSARLYRLIRNDLQAHIEHGNIPTNIIEILRAGGRDAATEILGHSSGANLGLDQFQADLDAAQSISQQNLENFTGLFSEAFNLALWRLRAAADRAGEPMTGQQRPNRSTQARLCMLVLASSRQWPTGIDLGLCRGTQMESVHPGFTDRLVFNDLYRQLGSRSLVERICLYRNYFRRSRLYEVRPLRENSSAESSPVSGLNLFSGSYF